MAPGATDTCGIKVIQTRPHPVERTEQGELEAVLIAIGPDHAVQQLFRNRVDPTLFVDRPDHQIGIIFVEVFVGAHAVHFRGRREDNALIIFHAVTDDLQVLFEIQFEHAQRVTGVFDRRRDRDQRQYHVAFLNMVFDPLGVNADIAFNEVETRAVEETADGVGADIQAVNLIVVVLQQALGQVVTDKAVNAEDQHAGTALHRHHRFAAQHRAGHQPQRLRQLGALHVNATFGLAGDDFQRPLLTGNH